MRAKSGDRRQFLKEGAALASLAVGANRLPALLGQTLPATTGASQKDHSAYGVPSRFEESARQPGNPGGPRTRTPLEDLVGIITPSGLHFVVEHSGIPDIDAAQHRLLIHGMVDRPLIFTLEELKRLPFVTRVHFIECGGNSSPTLQPYVRFGGVMKNPMNLSNTHGVMACSEWTGVPLSLLLREAGVQKGASWIVAEGADPGKHFRSIPLEKAMDDVLVAYGQNGEAVRPEQGYPLRLLLPGWVGNINVKWLRRIKVVDQPHMAIDETLAYTSLMPDGTTRWFQFEMPTKSVITFPSNGERLPSRGFYEISGLAWSGGGVIRRVEVSTDGGRSWKDAELQEPMLRKAHTRFRFPWHWEGEEAVIESRCTDDRGIVQPTLAEYSKSWGVKPDYFRSTTNMVNFFNPIYPWRVTREGRVQNALFA